PHKPTLTLRAGKFLLIHIRTWIPYVKQHQLHMRQQWVDTWLAVMQTCLHVNVIQNSPVTTTICTRMKSSAKSLKMRGGQISGKPKSGACSKLNHRHILACAVLFRKPSTLKRFLAYKNQR